MSAAGQNAGMRPTGLLGVLIGDLAAPVAVYAGTVPGLVPLVAIPLLLGCTALYGKRTGLGVRAALAVVRPDLAVVESIQGREQEAVR